MPAAQGTICRIQSASNEAGGSIQGRASRTRTTHRPNSDQTRGPESVNPWTKDGVTRANVFQKDFDHSLLMGTGVIGITGVNVLEHVALVYLFNLVFVTIHAHFMADTIV